ncbi:SDR family NAD(P)-dependent oxidoreductase [Gorillibacterium timonense]|uniref:SDR family NAD(P)-dependent oxidoreductase n=1 Tax=Gorillibacterium timonense TaxID=1689269 RepID=UPI0009EB8B6F|nr:SDR family oxidoreductase [Gorillibacterium timonense]
MKSRRYAGQTVLVTGASSGIGLEMAKLFARDGYRLVLVSRNRAALDRLAKGLRQEHQADVFVAEADLSIPAAVKELIQTLEDQNINIDVLVNNAGSGRSGLFQDIPWQEDEQVIQLNMASLTQLTKAVLPHMREKRAGGILNVASTGAYQPGPFTAVYYASKAYVLSFTQALRHELKPDGIQVSAFCPGATRTAFSERAGKRDQPGAMSAEQAARIGYSGFHKGKAVIVPGLTNKMAVAMSCALPGPLLARLVAKLQERVIIRK